MAVNLRRESCDTPDNASRVKQGLPTTRFVGSFEVTTARLSERIIKGYSEKPATNAAESTMTPFSKWGGEPGPYSQPCIACGSQGPTKYLGVDRSDVCASCWEGVTRLERIARGWEADVYAKHRERIFHRKEFCGPAIRPYIPDLGRRCEPDGTPENDHKRQPLPVDDPSGDDVCADAPGSDEYFGVRR